MSEVAVSKKITNANITKIALIFTVWVFSLFCGTLSTFIMQASNYFHASLTSAGTLESYQNFTVIGFSFIAFSFILRLGYRKSIIAILSIMVLLSIITPVVNSYWIVKLFLIGTGVVLVGMKICIYASAAIISKEENEQAGLLSLLEATWMISGMIGMWIIAFFMANSSKHWLDFLYLYAIIGVINIIVWMFVIIDESALEKEKAIPVKEQAKDILGICKNKLVIAAIVMIFIGSVLEMGFSAWLPGFYQDALHLSPALSLKIASFGGLAAFSGRIVAFILLKYMKWHKMLLCYYLSGLVFLVVILFSIQASGHEITNLGNVSIMAILLPIFGFFYAPTTPVLSSSILSRTSKEKQALVMTVVTIVFALASSATARGIGYTMDSLGGVQGFKIATIIPLIILIALVVPYYKFLHKTKVD